MTNDPFHRSHLLANLLISLVVIQPLPGLTQTATPTPSSPQLAAEREQLQNQKLKQEIEKLEQETVKIEKEAANLDQNFWEENSALVTTIASLANAVTAIVAIIGAFVTIGRQLTEIRREKNQQLDQRFTSIVERLGSQQSELKASATVSLLTFLEPGYEKYREQVYLIVLANLKLDNQDATILVFPASGKLMLMKSPWISNSNVSIQLVFPASGKSSVRMPYGDWVSAFD